MKICMITYQNVSNYEVLLQTYAIKKYTEDNGNAVEIIEYREDKKSMKEKSKVSTLTKKLYENTKVSSIKDFKRRFLNISKKSYFCVEDFDMKLPIADLYIDKDNVVSNNKDLDSIYNIKNPLFLLKTEEWNQLIDLSKKLDQEEFCKFRMYNELNIEQEKHSNNLDIRVFDNQKKNENNEFNASYILVETTKNDNAEVIKNFAEDNKLKIYSIGNKSLGFEKMNFLDDDVIGVLECVKYAKYISCKSNTLNSLALIYEICSL